jgi:hypothetical protein
MTCTPRRSSSALILAVGLLVPLLAGATTEGSTVPEAGSDVGSGEHDADGLRATARDVPLDGTGRTIELPEAPEMVILDEIEPGTELALRSRRDGAWSEWMHVHAEDDHAPDGRAGEEGAGPDGSSGVGPIWLGEGTDRVEIRREGGDDAELRVESLEVLDTPTTEAGPAGVGAAATSGTPFVRPRSAWATSGMGWASYNSGCGTAPSTTADVKAMVVHHTAGQNGYSTSDVPAIIRGIWYYHVNSRGWCDVAYNFFVDRFGRVWEGRQGGIDRPIIGGHTFGHNSETSGVAQLGNFDTTGAPAAMTAATAELVGWKLGLHGIDPMSRTVLTNRASTSTPKGLAPGASVDVPTVLGHRDLGSTACPGASTYARLSTIRGGARPGAHVVVLHRSFIGSVPSDSQYDGWYHHALFYGLDGTARAMTRSDAYAGPMVADLYRRVLDREPDAGGTAYWVRRIQAGLGLRDVSIGFYASAERYLKSGSTHQGFVRRLYEDILHRPPDAGGLRHWTDRMETGTPRTVVAGGFFASVESRADRVDRLYRSILGRAADPTGISTWSRYLLRHDDLDLAAHLTGSLEYLRRNLR